jgi:hypothetical protein
MAVAPVSTVTCVACSWRPARVSRVYAAFAQKWATALSSGGANKGTAMGHGLRRALVASALVLLAGCATTAKFDAMMQSWVGSSINDYIAANGYTPNQVLDDADGGKIYIFGQSAQGMYQMPTTTTTNVYGAGNAAYGTSTTSGGMMIPIVMQCTWTFRTNASGKIYRYSWRGNACKQR